LPSLQLPIEFTGKAHLTYRKMRIAILIVFLLLQLVFECGAFTLGVSGLRQRIAAQAQRKVAALYSDTSGSTEPNSPEEAAAAAVAAAIPGLIASA
jgi:hypothetical protein